MLHSFVVLVMSDMSVWSLRFYVGSATSVELLLLELKVMMTGRLY